MYTFSQETSIVFCSLFNGTAPELVVFDEGMISQITVKQFQNFIDRRVSLTLPFIPPTVNIPLIALLQYVHFW